MIRSRHALTLIELLVAMGIAVLLAAVVFAIYAGALRTLDSQGRWRAAAYPSAAALDALTLDLSSAVVPWGITNPPFTLAPAPQGAGGARLHFFASMPVSAVTTGATQALDLSRAYAVREIYYTLPAFDVAGTNGLFRTWAAFRTGAASGIASNEEAWKGVRMLRLEVFDGKQWTNAWGGGTNTTLPQAARVMLSAGDESAGRQVAAEVLIPAGRRIAAPESRK